MKTLNFLQTLAAAAAVAATCTALPTVDLGYEVHQAISYNETTGIYNFTNIRYGQAPIGDLRFSAPLPPAGRDSTVQVGERGRVCPQAMPEWFPVSSFFAAAYASGKAEEFDYNTAERAARIELAASGYPAPYANPNPHVTEDCLFLDVVVPRNVFDTRSGTNSTRKGQPVLVWFHGGAYAIGNKIYDNSGDPSGLIRASQEDGSDGIVYVSVNYRLGALGWLAGPSLQSAGGVSNAGLLDQRLALNWIQENIHLFGGDPNQVTVMGGSAGGGSIMHHITSYGGLRGAPFHRAISVSAGHVPVSSYFQQENATNFFLHNLNASSIQDARSRSSEEVILANALSIGASHYTSFTYGPVIDGLLVPSHPSLSLLKGDFSHNISIMAAEEPALDHFLSLYPDDGLDTTLQVIGDIGFNCNTDYMRKAFNNQTFNYQFRMNGGLHGADFPFLFYAGPPSKERYVTNFVKNGDPNGGGLPAFPASGANQTLAAFDGSGITLERDPTAGERCSWLQKALLF